LLVLLTYCVIKTNVCGTTPEAEIRREALMPKKIEWTAAQDMQIKRMRAEGSPWDAIAAVLGVTRWTAIERGRRIGAQRPPVDFVPEPENPMRDPLPAGHPRSWDALTRGTVLEGSPYPLPVFSR
jgi:hypothetical protein